MNPTLSVIVPTHNHHATLPRLFDSILLQDMSNFEVVLVDDCSDTACDAIVDVYTGKRLRIRHIRLETRHFQSARFVGMQEARGEVIAFADADDVFLGTSALQHHVSLFLSEKPDILHFRAVNTDKDGNFSCYTPWADPIAPNLRGKDIFIQYMNSATVHTGYNLWNKMFSRRLCQRVLPIAWSHGHKERAGDIYLLSLFLAHAEMYISSELVGYGYHYFDKKLTPYAFDYAIALCDIVDELVPVLMAEGFPERTINQFINNLYVKLTTNVGRFCREQIRGTCPYSHDDFQLTAALEKYGVRAVLKAFIIACGCNADMMTRIYHDVLSTQLEMKR